MSPKPKHVPGPWFLWKERAMQDEGLTPDEINEELLEYRYFEVMSGKPIGKVLRGRIAGCTEIAELDPEDFGDDEEESRQTALATARLIAAAPDLLAALKNLLAVHECKGGTTYHAGAIAQAAIAKAEGGTL